MSAWCKFFAPITVPTGGWDIRLTMSTVGTETLTAAAGEYATILHLLDEFEDKADDEGATWNATEFHVTANGIVSIKNDALTAVVWGSTDDDLSVAFGYDETESVSSNTLTATNPHTHGWYPGQISRGTTLGEGISYDSRWQPVDSISRVVAGSGAARLIGPSRQKYNRQIRFGAIHVDEMMHKTRGPICMADRWVYDSLYWYMDRDAGIRDYGPVIWNPGQYGTQLDPGHSAYNNDDDLVVTGTHLNYWLVTLNERPRFTPSATHPDWYSVDISLNAEPA